MRLIAALIFCGALIGVPAAAQAQFPPSGSDAMGAQALPLSITINGTTYTVGLMGSGVLFRSDASTEGTEDALVVPAGSCAVCQRTVSDADIECFASNAGGPSERRELHLEVGSIMCEGISPTVGRVKLLAGEDAFTVLNGVGAASAYANSFGEIESLDLSGTPTMDLPASAFVALHFVVQFLDAPPSGTSGVFYNQDALLLVKDIASMPPFGLLDFANAQAGKLDEEGLTPCGNLPITLYDGESRRPVGTFNGGGQVGVEGWGTGTDLALAPPAPNPAAHGVMLRYALPRADNVHLVIYDAAGRLVRVLAEGGRPAGEHTATWDLDDSAGHAVRTGYYFARLVSGGHEVSRGIAVTR